MEMEEIDTIAQNVKRAREIKDEICRVKAQLKGLNVPQLDEQCICFAGSGAYVNVRKENFNILKILLNEEKQKLEAELKSL